MKRSCRLSILAGIVITVLACTEKPQTLGSARVKDEAPFAGTKYPYAAPGWTAGDQKSWREQLRVRAQRGQNEFSRM